MKTAIVIGLICLAVLFSGCLQQPPEPAPSPEPSSETMTYDECVEVVLERERIFGPAAEEPVGATRVDSEGNVWTKTDEISGYSFDVEGNRIPQYSWKTDADGFTGTVWGNALIDEQPGGINYIPDLSECEKYIFTRNAEMEEGLSEIVDAEIENQKQKGISISLMELQVLNLAGKTQAFIALDCEEDMSFETESEIIGNIANELFEKYPEEYIEGDSWADVYCSYQMGWRIVNGTFGPMA